MPDRGDAVHGRNHAPGPDADDGDAAPPGAFRRTLLRVMVMQVIALALLWLLQSHFGS